jgi:oligoendopeptidase F
MQKNYEPTWDLDVIFPGGSESPEFAKYFETLEGDVAEFGRQVAGLEGQTVTTDRWVELFGSMQSIETKLTHTGAFVSCLMAQDVKDQGAKMLLGRVRAVNAAYMSALTNLDKYILQVPDAEWLALLEDHRLQPIAFPLQERRQSGAQKMPTELEALAGDLSVDGYHGWGAMYNTIIGRISVPFEKDGQELTLSVGQLQNMYSDADRDVRARAFAKWEEVFAENEDLFATTFNHLAGYRLQLYKHRGWDSVLKEPLDMNRMSQATLDAMWSVVDASRPAMLKFLNRKAELYDVKQLSYFDQYAPIGTANSKISYSEGAAFVIEQFRKFSGDMADFAQRAFEERWIEAEDRPGKRPGGFCTSFPERKESRIFMTYDDSMSTLGTLAHELGHAYHSHVMTDLPPMVQDYSMNVAETASTFAEQLVANAAIQHAKTDEERLVMLEDKIQRSVAFFLDIRSRFLFETAFYEERRKGLVSADKLNELMVNAQKEAYGDSLDLYHPHFWASKLHFHSTGVPFYNFPYTFGFLFSTGIYARAMQEGEGFADKYVALLRDTGSMTVEELAQRHLGVDLTQPDFWQAAADVVKDDIEEFLRLTAK